MKKNRKILTIFSVITIIFTMIAMIVLPNISRATKQTTSMWLKLVQPRNGTNYSIGDGTFDGNQDPAVAVDSTNGHRLWNVVQVDRNSGTYTDKNLYCMNADIDGFGTLEYQGAWYWNDRTSTASDAVEFTTTYDLKADKEAVLNTVFSDTNISTVSTNYNKILALLDIIYDPEDNTYGPNYKKTLLEAAGLNENDLDDGAISALQQAAMWYFTNHNSNIFINTYDNLDSNNPMATWLYTGTGNGLKYGSDVSQAYSQASSDLQAKAGKFYKYLISTANANANRYQNTTDVSLPITVTEGTGVKLEETTDSYIYGPLHVTKNNDFDYTVENFQVTKEGGTIVPYTFLNSNKQEASSATLKSFENQDFYIKVRTKNIDEVNVAFSVKYNSTQATLYTKDGSETTLQPVVLINRNQTSKPFSLSISRDKKFDLALRKYITAVNGEALTGDYVRNLTNIDTTRLASGADTTASYKHTKKPVKVSTNDIVTYTIKLYNEGEEKGLVTSIVDRLPEGLIPVETSGTITSSRKNITYNISYQENTNIYTLGVLRGANTTQGKELLAFNGTTLDYDEISFDCKVVAQASTTGDKILTNIAYIAGAYNEDKDALIRNVGDDRDSEPFTIPKLDGDIALTKDNMEDYHGSGKATLDDSNYFYIGRQDDDDFEKLLIEQEILPEGNYSVNIVKVDKNTNAKLSGAVFTVNGTDKTATDANGITVVENNKEITSATQADTYTITEKTAPGGYAKFDGTIILNVKAKRQENDYIIDTASTTMVVKDSSGNTITTDIPVTIDKQTNSITITVEDIKLEGSYEIDLVKEDANGENLSDPATFEVTNNQTNTTETKTTQNSKLDITNGAVEITADNVNTPDTYVIKETVPPDDYCKFDGIITLTVNKKEENGKYAIDGTPVYTVTDEDGNDITTQTGDTVSVELRNGNIYVYVKNYQFDLALRKFIAQVNDVELKTTDGTAYLREPVVDTSKLNTVDDNGNKVTTAIYNHPKTPVEVKKGDTVIYILRVYNEGDMDGYATEITDHLPEYLEFVEGDYNDKYKWTVSEDGRTVKSTYLENQLIEKVTKNNEGKLVLSYKDLPIMCKVKDTAKTSEVITNIADITKFTDKDKKEVPDRDSDKDNVNLPSDEELPKYKENEKGTYVPGQEDDDDFEKVIIYEFDLALRKWVTQAIVIENGEETVTETGHDAWDDPEEVVKVELHRKKLDSVTVKFRYSIRVYNQGDVEGYAKEITDYIPEGLKFDPEDNKGWTDEGNNVISTRLLEDTLLKPGEYADVEVVLTWINGKDNVGLKINTAEISEDYNDKGLPDKDSTPDNRKPGEDDIDDAPVILSIETGREVVYIGLGLGILATLGVGIHLIRKYVL